MHSSASNKYFEASNENKLFYSDNTVIKGDAIVINIQKKTKLSPYCAWIFKTESKRPNKI